MQGQLLRAQKTRVEFTVDGRAQCVTLSLSVVPAKSSAPRRGLERLDFFAKWKAFENEAAEMFPQRVPIGVTLLARLFAQGFSVSVLENVNPI